MFSALLITLREGLEAALIIAIVVSFLRRSGEGRLVPYAWAGVGPALLLSLVAGGALFIFAGELGEEASGLFEVGGTLLAVTVLTYVVIWMRNRGSMIKGGLELKTEQAARAATPLAVTLLAFAAVSREGLETALFLFAGASSSSAPSATAGAIAGIVLAVMAGAAIYRGSSRLNLHLFFNVTGIMLILFGAGMLSYVLHEAGEMGLLPDSLNEPLWDTGSLLGHREGFGAILKSTFGYFATPSLIQVAAYWSYLVAMLWLYFMPVTGRAAQPARENN